MTRLASQDRTETNLEGTHEEWGYWPCYELVRGWQIAPYQEMEVVNWCWCLREWGYDWEALEGTMPAILELMRAGSTMRAAARACLGEAPHWPV
jgi:hypothetical protein